MRVVARPKSYVPIEIFRDSVRLHSIGYKLLHDLLTSQNLFTINYTTVLNGSEMDVNDLTIDSRNRYDQISWNPYYTGDNRPIGRDNRVDKDPAHDYENAVTILAHELQHAFDFRMGMSDPTKLPANMQPPPGWFPPNTRDQDKAFQMVRWVREMNAVTIQNLIFKELTGIMGARNDYSGVPVPAGWAPPKSAGEWDWNTAFIELQRSPWHWGAKR